MAEIVSLGDDLMFYSRIRAEAEAAGTKAWQARDLAGLAERLGSGQIGLVLLDLDLMDSREVVEACGASVPVVAYGPHVHAERLRQAREAGCARVLPRSAFVKELAEIVALAKGC